MNMEINEFVNWAINEKWNVETRMETDILLPENISKRYLNIPEAYIEFLKRVKSCSTPGDKGWFICLDDYAGTSNSAFRWNEFESISLEAAADDEAWRKEITQFWDYHLPIFFSVHSGYEYFAINLKDSFGAIVTGYEPEFEETEKVVDSFAQFLNAIRSGQVIVV
jgi:hypothetical protein